MIKRVSRLEELDEKISGIDAILIKDDSHFFSDINAGINKIFSFRKKHPNVEVRIVINLTRDDDDYTKLYEIRDRLLESNLIGSKMVKIQLPGNTTINKLSKGFNDLYWVDAEFYSIKDIYEAEKLLNLIADNLNKQNFSNLEKILAAYIIAVTFKDYKEGNNLGESRGLYSILSNEYIVCEGYSKLFNTLLERLGIASSELIYDSGRGGHAVSVATVNDKKYWIYGKFIFDPTLDNLQKRKNESLKLKINTPVSGFLLSRDEFEGTHYDTTVDDLIVVDCGEKMQSVTDEDDLYTEISHDRVDSDIIERCFVEVYKKIYGVDVSRFSEFNKLMTHIFNSRKQLIEKGLNRL